MISPQRRRKRQHRNLHHVIPLRVIVDPAQSVGVDHVFGIVRQNHVEADAVLFLVEQHALINPVQAIRLRCGAVVRAYGEMHVRDAASWPRGSPPGWAHRSDTPRRRNRTADIVSRVTLLSSMFWITRCSFHAATKMAMAPGRKPGKFLIAGHMLRTSRDCVSAPTHPDPCKCRRERDDQSSRPLKTIQKASGASSSPTQWSKIVVRSQEVPKRNKILRYFNFAPQVADNIDMNSRHRVLPARRCWWLAFGCWSRSRRAWSFPSVRSPASCRRV